MKKQTNFKLPKWIGDRFQNIDNPDVTGDFTDDNAFWFVLTGKCPLIFEKYAIILHPFWLNYKVKEKVTSGAKVNDSGIFDADFKRLSWVKFFEINSIDFKFETAYKDVEHIISKISNAGWPKYLWAPAEEHCEYNEIDFFLKSVQQLYGNSEINYYFGQFSTINWDSDILCRDLISNYSKVQADADVRFSPTAIFPDSKDWCLVTPLDMPFTCIGGSEKLVKEILNNQSIEIFEIVPKYELIK